MVPLEGGSVCLPASLGVEVGAGAMVPLEGEGLSRAVGVGLWVGERGSVLLRSTKTEAAVV